MPFLPLQAVPMGGDTVRAYDAWLERLAGELDDPACDRYELCRRVLTDIFYPQYRDADLADLPEATRIAILQMDARNATLEPEYYAEIDRERYSRVKPLIWLWEMFDKSPLGENVHLGVRFRRVLARHIFKRCGSNFKCFHFVKLSFGYNIEMGDDVVIHRHVLLDDRGGIVMGNRVSVADFANIYSHSHDLADQRIVTTPRTVLGDGVRVTYHATVLAGVHMKPDSMLGALAVATKDVESGEVALGIPAAPKLRKPPSDERPELPSTRDPLVEDQPRS